MCECSPVRANSLNNPKSNPEFQKKCTEGPKISKKMWLEDSQGYWQLSTAYINVPNCVVYKLCLYLLRFVQYNRIFLLVSLAARYRRGSNCKAASRVLLVCSESSHQL